MICGNIHILKMSPSMSVSFENLTFMVDKTDSHVGLSLLESSSHETETLDVLLSVIEEGDVVIDVGANIGTMTLPLMRAVGKLGKV
jgi:ubiquinone/menaquinone biosynthesis C-methylase UbiE